jgi:hypothetical protein
MTRCIVVTVVGCGGLHWDGNWMALAGKGMSLGLALDWVMAFGGVGQDDTISKMKGRVIYCSQQFNSRRSRSRLMKMKCVVSTDEFILTTQPNSHRSTPSRSQRENQIRASEVAAVSQQLTPPNSFQ